MLYIQHGLHRGSPMQYQQSVCELWNARPALLHGTLVLPQLALPSAIRSVDLWLR
jgi:hypothetical protein